MPNFSNIQFLFSQTQFNLIQTLKNMIKVSRFIIRLLKCLICILTGEYKDKDKGTGYIENGGKNDSADGDKTRKHE